MKAYKSLINHALSLGHVISVHDGEEFAVKRTTNTKEIYAVIDSVEQSELVFRDKEGNKVGWALVIDYPEEPENSVADFTDNEWMNNWSDNVYKH